MLKNVGVDTETASTVHANASANEARSAFARQLSRYTRMTMLETVQFLQPDRPHIVEMIFAPDDEFATLFTTNFMTMSPEVLLALTGGTLTSKQLLAINGTALAAVVEGDGGVAKASTRDKSVAMSSEQSIAEEEAETEAMLAAIDAGDLDALLENSTDDASHTLADVNDDDDEIFTIKDDLQYLELVFAVLLARIRLKTHRLGETGLLRSDLTYSAFMTSRLQATK